MCTMQAFCGGIHEHFMCPYFLWAAFCCLFLGTRAGAQPAQTRPCTHNFIPAFIALGGSTLRHGAPKAWPVVYYALHLM